MGDTTEIKKGAVIRHNNDLWIVVDFNFVNPGKGSAFTKTRMKSISTGKNLEITYKPGESVDTVQVYRKNAQFLYISGDNYAFMDQGSYETVEISADVMGDDAKYLKEGLVVIMATHEGNPVAIQLPKKITYTVKEAPDAVKGDTASGNVTKEIVLDNDLNIQAPIFIKQGEEIVVNSETGEYAGRSTD